MRLAIYIAPNVIFGKIAVSRESPGGQRLPVRVNLHSVYLEKNSHCTRFNRVSTFRFPIQRFSIPQQYFCSHWLRNLFRVFACINTSKYVITRRSLPNQSMSLFVWCIPRLNSAGLLVRVCGSFRTLSLSMRLSGLVRKWTQKYKQKHSCIWSRYSFQQSHYFERFGRIQT